MGLLETCNGITFFGILRKAYDAYDVHEPFIIISTAIFVILFTLVWIVKRENGLIALALVSAAIAVSNDYIDTLIVYANYKLFHLEPYKDGSKMMSFIYIAIPELLVALIAVFKLLRIMFRKAKRCDQECEKIQKYIEKKQKLLNERKQKNSRSEKEEESQKK